MGDDYREFFAGYWIFVCRGFGIEVLASAFFTLDYVYFLASAGLR